MAKQIKVYLGYEDEVVEGRRLSTCNHTVDKIGGLPDWPPIETLQFSTKCPVCSLHRPMIVQCCAPIKNSTYNRTLYVFACINPNCWNQSESWTCVRSQVEEKCLSPPTPTVAMQTSEGNLSWCQGADDWDENENGNNLMNVDNNPSPNNIGHRHSDDDDESNSFDIDTVEQALGNLQVFDATNANNFPIQGAVGAVGVPVAEAEIEGKDDSDLVTVDTPTIPTGNIEALFQETAELPPDIRSRLTCAQLQFVPKYIYIEEETKKPCNNDVEAIELLTKYKRENDMEVNAGMGNAACPGGEDDVYEDAAPLHGDRLFHAFLMRLRRNPDQILRYSRDVPPLLGAPLTPADNIPPYCSRCNSRLICELQLLPRFTETLVLAPNNISLPYLHFLSVLVFTCSQSCWQPSDTVVRETVVFQPEI